MIMNVSMLAADAQGLSRMKWGKLNSALGGCILNQMDIKTSTDTSDPAFHQRSEQERRNPNPF